MHKPVKATLRLEIERLSNEDHEDGISESGSFSNGSFDADSRSIGGASLSGRSTQGLEFTKSLYNGHHQKGSPGHRDLHSGSASSLELGRSEVVLWNMEEGCWFKDGMWSRDGMACRVGLIVRLECVIVMLCRMLLRVYLRG